ncbi:type III pantothenate kinase [Segniliparus rugosus]|uniref:Type III pantothenate kinase n=1 Tax=Segniliparus rugosus (strain ATCC BAA-974 / DSM 45345 / CCUG 50838 / CIP 108380 / JCM 13579 / CDC 945) TaxID=679197 RepID=E5XQY3_SEGRC|nr:type III pantothenate kinase [Segniliparus rugosus]EFV13223.2 pantothenate kinase, type III [Segniliparus rugosus ATCC BAA-974]
MLLVFDIGNSNVSLGLFEGSGGSARLVDSWRVHTDPNLTGDEIYLAAEGFLGDRVDRIAGVAALSTVPALLRELRLMIPRHFAGRRSLVVEPGVRTGVPLLVDNPKGVGADRVVNALAAFHHRRTACVVVDVGTTTVVDAVSAKGEFLGGAIAPGMAISVDALSQWAATLPKVELTRPRSVIGKNTVESLQSGVLFGFAGQVDGLVRRMMAELSGEKQPRVVLTGGLAPLLVDELDTPHEHEPALTLTGLRMVFERHARPNR